MDLRSPALRSLGLKVLRGPKAQGLMVLEPVLAWVLPEKPPICFPTLLPALEIFFFGTGPKARKLH